MPRRWGQGDTSSREWCFCRLQREEITVGPFDGCKNTGFGCRAPHRRVGTTCCLAPWAPWYRALPRASRGISPVRKQPPLFSSCYRTWRKVLASQHLDRIRAGFTPFKGPFIVTAECVQVRSTRRSSLSPVSSVLGVNDSKEVWKAGNCLFPCISKEEKVYGPVLY